MYALIATVGIALLLAGLAWGSRSRTNRRYSGSFRPGSSFIVPPGADGAHHHHHGDIGGGAHHGGFGGGHHGGGFGGGGHHGG